MPTQIPQSLFEWMNEIVCAYKDAAEAIPFGFSVNAELTKHELFHFAPLVCLKFRGIKRTQKSQKLVTEAALSSYVANEQVHGNSLTHSIMAFSLCYIVSHYALDLINETESRNILDFILRHLDEIEKRIES
ncbi:conserved hypothetical protein [Nitrosomonas nitrosa]|jgi:hypothetical protein|uniref:Uncharacterized protein n=1 Tax=Nitrosomonas nitrosa TaxID=52442 RepID=A0A1I4TNY1_9PROT|nr:hypothetical protein [Nitrosomonas nitrosa]CAE6486767.1 conserved hypothetical protein [Nitrosomonas nitrosa]SFM78399.1 hypothetical protein SAMN05421880_13330 [Nitrosomonas nitrosa]